MVISFEEKDRASIEVKGIMIIEFKRRLYNMGKEINDARKVLKKFIDKTLKVFNAFTEYFLKIVDSVRMVIEVIKDCYHYPTSRRYKIVKVFSKCTGTNLCFGWEITYRIKRWLVRSYLQSSDRCEFIER